MIYGKQDEIKSTKLIREATITKIEQIIKLMLKAW